MSNILVMVNGLSPEKGKMARAVAEKVIQAPDMMLYPYSLTGEDVEEKIATFPQGHVTNLIKPSQRASSSLFPHISVDFTHPTAVNENADFYCTHKLNFVMGTTGGDREALERRVRESDICAVIAPNMAKQIVAFQAMMKYAAETFPNAFEGYRLEIVESHQKGKADTSGTAKAMVDYFNKLGIPFTKEQIEMIRELDEQRDLGVPEEALGGHGWHTYTFGTKDDSVFFQFTHNVNGREVYANGTMDAIRYLKGKVDAGEKGKVYSMIDVLKGK